MSKIDLKNIKHRNGKSQELALYILGLITRNYLAKCESEGRHGHPENMPPVPRVKLLEMANKVSDHEIHRNNFGCSLKLLRTKGLIKEIRDEGCKLHCCLTEKGFEKAMRVLEKKNALMS